MEEMEQNTIEYGTTIEQEINAYIEECYSCDYENISYLLEKKYSFYYFHVVIKSGYYEGFTIDIENNFGVFYSDYIEKREAQKEVTLLKQFLIECAGLGLVSCCPSWCTSYSDYAGTINAINEAIKEIREEIRNTPTWNYYNNNIPCRKAV